MVNKFAVKDWRWYLIPIFCVVGASLVFVITKSKVLLVVFVILTLLLNVLFYRRN